MEEIRGIGKTTAKDILKSGIIIDAIFGIGLNRNVGEPFRSIIEGLNAHSDKIISVDIPSGLDATTGKVHGFCVRACVTVTFSFAKKGLYLNEGPKYSGKIIVADIGIPRLPCSTSALRQRLGLRSPYRLRLGLR